MAWSDFFLPSGAMTADEQQANYARQVAALNQKVADRQAAGDLTDEQYSFYESNLGPLEDQNAAAAAGFKEGLGEGINNVLTAPGKVVGAVGSGAGTVLGGILKNIP